MYLLGSIEIPSGLVLLHCSSVGVLFAPESPHARQNILVGWNVLPVEEAEVAVIPFCKFTVSLGRNLARPRQKFRREVGGSMWESILMLGVACNRKAMTKAL